MPHLHIHCFQHVPYEDIDCISKWIFQHEHALTYTRFYEKDVSVPSEDTYDWLIVMGGPMGIYDETDFPWLASEKHAIREAIDAGKTVLGICLGAQLIAHVLGAKVTKNPEKEIGWLKISLKKSENNNPLMLQHEETSLTVFQWHGDTFEIPVGAQKLASSVACANQAFLYKEKVLGLQFHLEVSAQGIAKMLTAGASEFSVGGKYIQTAPEILKQQNHFQSNNVRMFSLLDELEKQTNSTSANYPN